MVFGSFFRQFMLWLSVVLAAIGIGFEILEPEGRAVMVPHVADTLLYDPAGYEDTESIGSTALDAVRVEEDEPQWDCRTMGNRICGKDRGKQV